MRIGGTIFGTCDNLSVGGALRAHSWLAAIPLQGTPSSCGVCLKCQRLFLRLLLSRYFDSPAIDAQ